MTGFLTALVIRAEWSLATAKTRTQKNPNWHVGEKQNLLKKCDSDEEPELSTLTPTQPISPPTSDSGSRTAEFEFQLSRPKPRAIPVPPVDPFHLAKGNDGRLKPFPSPIFNILLLTTFLCYVPSILLSTPALNHLTETNTTYELLWILPAQIWTVFAHPIVLVVLLLVKKNKSGRKIWRYGEKWSKDLPPKMETIAPVSFSPRIPTGIGS